MGKLIDISIVSPVYNASLILPKLVQEIEKVMVEMGVTYEIILVDDRSPDNSWEIMQDLSVTNLNLKIFRLSRNFGQHPTIMAGLSKANGHWVVVMDCDLQDQPKEIKKLYIKALQGFDVVLAKRQDRKDNFFKKLSSKLFSICFSFLTGTKYDNEIANFGIYRNKVIQSILVINDYIKFFPLFVKFVGFNQTSLNVEHASRESGNSSYNFYNLIKLAFNSMISFSNRPLKLFVKFGTLVSIISLIVGLYNIYLYFTKQIEVQGYTSLIISIWFLSGIILTSIGITGIYVGKIFNQVKNRPIYIIDEKYDL